MALGVGRLCPTLLALVIGATACSSAVTAPLVQMMAMERSVMSTTVPGLLYEANFNSGTSIPAMGFMYSGNTTAKVVDIAGERAAQISLNHYSDPVSYRTEIQPNNLPSPDFTNGMFAKIGQEYWYGMRVYMPSNWDTTDRAGEAIMQFHSQPDSGEAWRNPPILLMIQPDGQGGERFKLQVRTDATRITPTSGGEGRYDSSKIYDLGPVTDSLGKWSTWVWHVKWSYDNTGDLTLYKDGKPVLDLQNQANCFNDATGPYLKFGDYKWDWQSSADTGADNRTLYFDDIRVGNASASYGTVAPGGTTTTPTNHVPGGYDDSATTTSSQPVVVNVLANDRDADGDALKVSRITSAAAHGTATINADNTVTYVSSSQYVGTDSFNYEVSDGKGGLDVATATITVTAPTSTAGMRINGTAGADVLSGGAGNDWITGLEGNDELRGNGGNDRLRGNEGADRLFGGDGNDQLCGGNGNDVLDGGNGSDTIDYFGWNIAHKVDLAAGRSEAGPTNIDTFTSIENATGGDAADQLYGDMLANVLRGEAGNDKLWGRGGNDILTGGTGYDTFMTDRLGSGQDRITDYTDGVDKIDLRMLAASIKAATGHGLTAQYLAFVQDGTATSIRVDVDGAWGPAAPETIFTLDQVSASTLQIGTDVLI